MRTRIERHFQKMGVPTRRLDSSVNFANVQYLSTQDALVLANSTFAPLSDSAAQELKRVFGEPKHILRVELNADLQRGDWPICYDLDLAFHMTMNTQGEPVALVHKPCISADPAAGELGTEAFVSQLKALGFRVIEIGEKDQLSLATNFVTSDDRPGEALFARGNLSAGLLRQLQEAGIQPVFADGQGKKLGYTGRDLPIWGLHCLTVNFHKPTDGEPNASRTCSRIRTARSSAVQARGRRPGTISRDPPYAAQPCSRARASFSRAMSASVRPGHRESDLPGCAHR